MQISPQTPFLAAIWDQKGHFYTFVPLICLKYAIVRRSKDKNNQTVLRFAVALEDKGLYCHIKPAENTLHPRHSPASPPPSFSLTRAKSNPLLRFHSQTIVLFLFKQKNRIDFILELVTVETQFQTVNLGNAGMCKLTSGFRFEFDNKSPLMQLL